MMTIDSLYREEDGRVLIEMKLSSVIQLFNTFDPAPFREKELDINAESYIIETVKDFPRKTEFKIVFYLPDGIYDTKEAMEIPKAIRAHFEYKTLTQRRKFRERYIFGQFALVVGISFLAIATAASLTIDTYYGSYPLGNLIATALEVTGWVAMWEPVTVFLYQLWPIIKLRKIYEKISRTEIDIRPYHKVSSQSPELLVAAPACQNIKQ